MGLELGEARAQVSFGPPLAEPLARDDERVVRFDVGRKVNPHRGECGNPA
jgi:hypothetical protein